MMQYPDGTAGLPLLPFSHCSFMSTIIVIKQLLLLVVVVVVNSLLSGGAATFSVTC